MTHSRKQHHGTAPGGSRMGPRRRRRSQSIVSATTMGRKEAMPSAHHSGKPINNAASERPATVLVRSARRVALCTVPAKVLKPVGASPI